MDILLSLLYNIKNKPKTLYILIYINCSLFALTHRNFQRKKCKTKHVFVSNASIKEDKEFKTINNILST